MPTKPKPARPQSMAEELRQLVTARGLSGYALAEKSGVNRANVNRFLSGQAGLSLDSFVAIVEALGLRLAFVGRRVNPKVNRSSARPDRKPVVPELVGPGVEGVEPEVE